MNNPILPKDLRNRFFEDRCTKSEHKKVLEWMRNASPEELSQFMDEQLGFMNTTKKMPPVKSGMSFHPIKDRVKKLENERRRSLIFRRSLQVAASLMILLAGYYSFPFLISQDPAENDNLILAQTSEILEYKSDYGQQKKISLVDGTSVRLNAGTKVRFPENFDPEKRELYLEGQAFFDVERDTARPFIITTTDMQVKVLGTSFDIRSYKEEAITVITVLTGKIEVTVEGQEEKVFLLANEQLMINKEMKSCNTDNVDAHKCIAWINGILRFDNVPLKVVFMQMERWFDIEIVALPGVNLDCFVSGQHQNEGIFRILEALKFSHGVEYDFKDQQIQILNTKCN
ncbi:MAG: FecR domain-containing protein [Bacteroidales bacterium]|jgi:ferric-dicitrate binding protein FerR (iron transport regulator)